MSETPLRLLLVEDSEAAAALLLHALRRGSYAVKARRIETAETLVAALLIAIRNLLRRRPD